MRFYFFLLCCCSAFSLWANDNLHSKHKQFQQLSSVLHEQFQRQNNHSSLISSSSYHYVQGVGGIFIFAFNQSLSSWHADNHIEGVSQSSSTEAQQQANTEFNQIRAQAKHLSHQIYGLERKLKSLKQSQNQSDDPQLISRLIEESQAQLEQLELEKQQLKPKYDYAQNRVSQENTNLQRAISDYLQNVGHQLFTSVCRNPHLLEAVTASSNESMSFILKQAGDEGEFGLKDIVYRITPALQQTCIEQAINEESFNRKLLEHTF